jgi:hypothetical protein
MHNLPVHDVLSWARLSVSNADRAMNATLNFGKITGKPWTFTVRLRDCRKAVRNVEKDGTAFNMRNWSPGV